MGMQKIPSKLNSILKKETPNRQARFSPMALLKAKVKGKTEIP
jgi:hypothetical protein